MREMNKKFLLILLAAIIAAPAARADWRYAPGAGANTGNSFNGLPQGWGSRTGNSNTSPYFYQNLPGTGYYRPFGYGYGGGYNYFGPPVPINGGYFSFKTGNSNITFWKAP